MRKRTPKGSGMERQIAIRLDAPIHDHLRQRAAALGLSLTEYVRFMACWHAPYILLWTDVRKILESGKPDLADEFPRLLSAVQRLETGEAEVARLVEHIQAGLAQMHEESRKTVVELKAELQQQAQQVGAWADALRLVRKRLSERAEAGAEAGHAGKEGR